MSRNQAAKQNKGYNNHGTPINRRDMLAQGALGFSAYALMPSVLSLFSRQARAADAECAAASAGGSSMVPFLIFDLAGGGNIAGTNVIVGGAGGQTDFLPAGSYASIGLAATAEPTKLAPDTSLGLAFQPASQMLAGIKQFAAATTIAGVDGAVFCTTSADDTRTNPHNPLYWIAKAGLGGQLVSLIGSSDGTSGGNAAAPPASIDPSKQPSRITRPADALGLVNAGKLATLLAAGSTPAAASADVQKVLNAIKTMSDSKLAMFQAQDVPTQVQQLIHCGYINSSDFLTQFTPAKVDPSQDPILLGTAAAPGPYATIATDTTIQAAGSIAKLVLDGYAGGGVVSLGGFDYHGQGRATQDAKDLLAGQMIGRALQLAALKNKPLMIYVYTDGGVSATGGTANAAGILAFSSDSGDRSAAFSLVFKPGGVRPEIRNGLRQVGSFSPAGAVNTTASPISASVPNLGKAIVANYLAINGFDKEEDLVKAVGDNPFGADLDKVKCFTKIV